MRRPGRMLSIITLAFLITGMLLSICAYAQDDTTEKYVKEVRFFLGHTEEEAASWLQENGYEPILAGTEGETAPEGESLVLGIRRTADPREAIADFGVYAWNSQDVLPGQEAQDAGTALYTITPEAAGDLILADSITVRYGDSSIPEGCCKMLALTPFETSKSEKASETVYLFWNTQDADGGILPASSFSSGMYLLIATAGLMIGIIGTTIFLLPRRKKEEQTV